MKPNGVGDDLLRWAFVVLGLFGWFNLIVDVSLKWLRDENYSSAPLISVSNPAYQSLQSCRFPPFSSAS